MSQRISVVIGHWRRRGGGAAADCAWHCDCASSLPGFDYIGFENLEDA